MFCKKQRRKYVSEQVTTEGQEKVGFWKKIDAEVAKLSPGQVEDLQEVIAAICVLLIIVISCAALTWVILGLAAGGTIGYLVSFAIVGYLVYWRIWHRR